MTIVNDEEDEEDPMEDEAMDTFEQQIDGMNYANHDRELMNECHLIDEDLSFHNRDNCEDFTVDNMTEIFLLVALNLIWI